MPRSPKRQKVVPRGRGPVTSKNRPLAGSEYSVNNAANSMLYPGTVYNRFFSGTSPNHLTFYIFDDPYKDPSTYSPTIYGHTMEELLQGGVGVPNKRDSRVSVKRNVSFTDGRKHDVVAVRYKGRQHKVKFQGTNPERNGIPYFYIEVYENGELRKVYGDFSEYGSTPESSQQADFGKKSEIRYLKSFV